MKRQPTLGQRKNKAREVVTKILYEMDLGGLDADEARHRIERKLRRRDTRQFALKLFETTFANIETIDAVLREIVTNWDVERMAAFDRNLLRMATAEIVFLEDIPERVTINEAIEIAKRFSTENSGRFVNGILDKVARIRSEIRHNL